MSHLNVRDVLDSLTLAKEAYDALPDMRRQIDDLQAAVASKDRLLSQTQTTLEETIAGKATVEAKLKEVETDRDSYFFRHVEAQEKLDKMAQLIGVGTGKASGQTEQPTTATEPVTQGQSATDPTITPESPTSPNVSVPSNTTEGQSAVPPTQEPLTSTGTTEPTGDTSQHPIYSMPLVGDTKPSEPVVNRPEDWGKAQSDSGDETTYEGRPSWEKPHDMSWNEWEAKGGTIPQWMKHNG